MIFDLLQVKGYFKYVFWVFGNEGLLSHVPKFTFVDDNSGLRSSASIVLNCNQFK